MADKRTDKRLNYFTGQLLDEDDFSEEQQYHVDALRAHNKNFHTWGIAQGLNVEKSGKKNVTIGMGMAIDNMGRQIVVDQLTEIDLSASTATTLYLTISYSERETDFKEGEGEKGNTRILEEPCVEYDQKMPDEPSMKIVLAKLVFDRKNDLLESIDVGDRVHAGNVGGDIEANSIAFSLPTDRPDHTKMPRIKGVNGSNPGIEILSQNTTLKGDLNLDGILTGKLNRGMVGMYHIVKGSVPISRMRTLAGSGSAEIGARSEAKVEFTEPSKEHRFFITSVIPTTPDSTIEWKWRVEREANQFSYVLVVRNLSKKKIDVEFKYYEIME